MTKSEVCGLLEEGKDVRETIEMIEDAGYSVNPVSESVVFDFTTNEGVAIKTKYEVRRDNDVIAQFYWIEEFPGPVYYEEIKTISQGERNE